MVWVRNAFSAPLDDAVRAITRFARTRKRKLFYPRKALPLYLGMWLGQSLIPDFLVAPRRRAQDPEAADGHD
jgi:hypothetical protein